MRTIDLKGNWVLNALDANRKDLAGICMRIPGDVHTALLEKRIIADPYWADNELGIQWVEKTDWTITRTFEAAQEDLELSAVLLEMTMVDTMASVLVNGSFVGRTCSQFRFWSLDVKPFLKSGLNTISITFDSPLKSAIAEAAKERYFIPYSVYPVSSPYRNMLRKCQCQSGWDWGPCINSSGIYGDIAIRCYEKARILDSRLFMKTSDLDTWVLEERIRIEAFEQCTLPFSMSIETLGSWTTEANVGLGISEIVINATVKSPRLWWPNGWGEQALYSLVLQAGECKQAKKIGFRTIEVHDEDFGFIVNGRPIFAKGANWIPPDAIISHQEAHYRGLLEAAKDANMNAVRLWGGGQYERESFYELCDELGILIWHDCMFSCSMYSSRDEFLDNVTSELDYQLRRIHDHASIALWCGNNECLGSIGWYEESRANKERYFADYDRLNHGVIARKIKSICPDQKYWPSSPCAGEGNYGDNWHDDSKGDMHFWSVWHEGRSFEHYRTVKPRFVSEFGYQSFPSLTSIKSFCPADQLNLTSPIMEDHQRNLRGNSIILENFSRYYRFPSSFEAQVILSQIQQAKAMQTAIEYYRTLMPYCLGTLYWQLDDCWPVASWSSLEYGGRYKVLHYSARRFYESVAPIMYKDDKDVIHCFIVNDGPSKAAVKWRLKAMGFDGRTVFSEKESLESGSMSSTEIKTLSSSSSSRDFFLNLKIEVNGKTLETTLLPLEEKRCPLEDPRIKSTVRKTENGYEVDLECSRPAFNVVLDEGSARGRFSDNNFALRPGKVLTIAFETKDELKALKIWDLYSLGR